MKFFCDYNSDEIVLETIEGPDWVSYISFVDGVPFITFVSHNRILISDQEQNFIFDETVDKSVYYDVMGYFTLVGKPRLVDGGLIP